MIKHGMINTPTYASWENMIQRCYNPHTIEFHRYGGRGIVVCPQWRNFINFFNDMGYRPEGRCLDRKNNDGNYNKKNCRWATKEEQEANKKVAKGMEHHRAKVTDAQILKMRSKFINTTISIKELAKEYSLSRQNVSKIIHRELWKHLP